MSNSGAQEEGDLPGLCLLRGAQAVDSERARHAILLRPLELDRRKAVDRAVAAIAVEPLAGRTDTGFLLKVELEVLRLEVAGFLGRAALVVQRVGFALCVSWPA